ncbi:MAG: hypothetical protein HRU01_03170 [Myxococcales bacterium]|nr:hypothetical protein [Myxococcales bacterium]
MQKMISYYDVDWNRETRTGGMSLAFDDRSRVDLRPIDLDELSLICNILRVEKPVYYDEATRTFSTQSDPVNDG